MAGQLIPPPELAPPRPKAGTPQDRLRAWLGMLAAGEKLYLAGLRNRVGTGEKLKQECRRLYRLRRDDRLKQWIQRDMELAQRSSSNAS